MKILLLILIIISVSGFAQNKNTRDVDPLSINKKEYADKIKIEFLHVWNAYKKYAWGHDQLMPLTKTSRDWYSEPMLFTPVDAFTTMKLMK